MDKKQQILDLISEFIKEKKNNNKWEAGKDWVQYSGPYYDDKEFVAGVDSLLKEWFILGEKGREFELKFAPLLGKKDGIVVNSGSSANLLMVSLLTTKRGGNLPKGSKFITPVVCFPTTINPLIQNGFVPVFVDIATVLKYGVSVVPLFVQESNDAVFDVFAILELGELAFISFHPLTPVNVAKLPFSEPKKIIKSALYGACKIY